MADSKRPDAGVVPVERLREVPGLTFLESVVNGTFPAPPICATLGFDLVEAAPGRAAFAGTPGREVQGPFGTVQGGYALTLLDSCMGCAVHSLLAAGQGFATIETKVNFVRPLTDTTGLVRAEGKIVHAGERIVTAEGRLVDAAGKLYAHGTSTCLILTLRVAQ